MPSSAATANAERSDSLTWATWATWAVHFPPSTRLVNYQDHILRRRSSHGHPSASPNARTNWVAAFKGTPGRIDGRRRQGGSVPPPASPCGSGPSARKKRAPPARSDSRATLWRAWATERFGLSVDGTRADLVPGKVQSGYQNYHSLYRRKNDSWTQTNVKLHIDAVRGSDRQREIRAVKTWRVQHGLEFPSLYLELFTIQALSGRSKSSLAANVLHALATIGSDLVPTRIVDPSNSNNLISDDLTLEEKKRVATTAASSAVQSTWEKILW